MLLLALPIYVIISVRNLLVLPNKIVLMPKAKIEARAAKTLKSLHAEILTSSPVKGIARQRAAERAAKPIIRKTKRVRGNSHETTKASQMIEKGDKGTLPSR